MRASNSWYMKLLSWHRGSYCNCEAKVRSSSVSVVYVVRLRIIFSKAALQKRGSMEPIEPPLDPPLQVLKGSSLVLSTIRKPVMNKLHSWPLDQVKVGQFLQWLVRL